MQKDTTIKTAPVTSVIQSENPVCLYPLIGRPDWDNAEHYHASEL
ncbi:hypothetical protein BH10BAC3_BH10BAC3_14900 [soil metagenome]